MGKEFDEAAAKLNRLLSAINPAELQETLALLRKTAENLLDITENLKRRIQ